MRTSIPLVEFLKSTYWPWDVLRGDLRNWAPGPPLEAWRRRLPPERAAARAEAEAVVIWLPGALRVRGSMRPQALSSGAAAA